MSKIAFRERGQGKVLLCLHGYAGSVLHWDQVAQILQKDFRVVVPNLSHLFMGKEKLTFSNQVDLLVHFIKEHYASEPIYIAGISYGRALAWGISLRYPELIDKVIFINPMPPRPAASFAMKSLKTFFAVPMNLTGIYYFLKSRLGKYFLKKAAGVFRNLQTDFSLERMKNLDGRKLLFVSHLLYKFAWILKNERWYIWESKLELWVHDCLLIYDKHDLLFDPEHYENFAVHLSCENVFVTEDAGHISITNQPVPIAAAIRDFLNKKKQSKIVA